MLIIYILVLISIILLLIIIWKYKLINLLILKFAEIAEKRKLISTPINKALPYFNADVDYHPQQVSDKVMEKLAQEGKVFLKPGLYEFHLQSFCLDTGKCSPWTEYGSLITPLKGKQSNVIKILVKNSLTSPKISQRDIQSLIWAITMNMKYESMPEDFQLTARQLLSKKELRMIRKSFWKKIPEPIKGFFFSQLKLLLPKNMLKTISQLNRVKEKFSTVGTTYEELERVAIRFRKSQVKKDISEIKSHKWFIAEEGYFIRVFCENYMETRVQVWMPKKDEYFSEIDKLGRKNKMSIKNICKSKDGQAGFFGKRLFFAFPLLISGMLYQFNSGSDYDVEDWGTVKCFSFNKAIIFSNKDIQRVLVTCRKYK